MPELCPSGLKIELHLGQVNELPGEREHHVPRPWFDMRRSIMATASLIVTLLVLVGTGAAAAAAPAAEDGKILFRRYLNDDHTRDDIFSIRPDGTGLFRVTHSGEDRVGT